jgi:hypothetical protein
MVAKCVPCTVGSNKIVTPGASFTHAIAVNAGSDGLELRAGPWLIHSVGNNLDSLPIISSYQTEESYYANELLFSANGWGRSQVLEMSSESNVDVPSDCCFQKPP